MFDGQTFPVWPGLNHTRANILRIRCVIKALVGFFPINFSLEAKMYLRGNLRAKKVMMLKRVTIFIRVNIFVLFVFCLSRDLQLTSLIQRFVRDSSLIYFE